MLRILLTTAVVALFLFSFAAVTAMAQNGTSPNSTDSPADPSGTGIAPRAPSNTSPGSVDRPSADEVMDDDEQYWREYLRRFDDLYDDERFDEADTNDDEVLSENEWEGELNEKELKLWHFDEADANGDGLVTREEAGAYKRLIKRRIIKHFRDRRGGTDEPQN